MTRVKAEHEEGFTIIELLVSMILLAVVSTTFLAATNAIYAGIHKQQGIVNAADGNRRAFELLDKQVRYASAINTPGTAPDGNYYVEYQWSKSTGSLDAVDVLAVAAQPDHGRPPVPQLDIRNDAEPYAVVVNGRYRSHQQSQHAAAVLAARLPTAQRRHPAVPGAGRELHHQARHGNCDDRGAHLPNDATNTKYVGFTALNTPNSQAPSPAVCQEVARS